MSLLLRCKFLVGFKNYILIQVCIYCNNKYINYCNDIPIGLARLHIIYLKKFKNTSNHCVWLESISYTSINPLMEFSPKLTDLEGLTHRHPIYGSTPTPGFF